MSARAARSPIPREALRNLLASPVRTIVTAALVAVFAALTLLATAYDVSSIHHRWVTAVDAGSTTFVVTSPRLNSIPAARCDQLRAVNTVVAAGGRISSRSISPLSFRSERVQLETVTPGFAQLMWPMLAGRDTSVVPSPAVAERFGLVPGAIFALGAERSEAYELTAVPFGEPRLPQISNSLLVTGAPTGLINECYVESEPGAIEDVERLLAGWFDPGVNPSVLRLVQPKATDVDSQKELEQRASRVAPAVAGAVLVIFALGSVWARRQEYALYKLLGLKPKDLATMMAIEWLFLYLLPTAIGFTAAMLFVTASLLMPVVWTAVSIDMAVYTLLVMTIPALATLATHRIDSINVIKGE